MKLTLPVQLVQDLVAHSRSEAPREAVGLLGALPGAPNEVVGWAALQNRSHTPESAFMVMPDEQYRLEMKFRERGWVVAAAFHSHPTRDAQPSGMDCEFLSERRPMLIVSLVDPPTVELDFGDDIKPHDFINRNVPSPLRAWIARDGHTEEVQLVLFEVTTDVAYV